MNKLRSGGFTAAACLLISFGNAPSLFGNCCLHYQTTTFSVPTAVNTEHQFVRRCRGTGSGGGTFYPFDFPRSRTTNPFPVTLNNYVVGYYFDQGGHKHGFGATFPANWL
jgi:hypothetical protein